MSRAKPRKLDKQKKQRKRTTQKNQRTDAHNLRDKAHPHSPRPLRYSVDRLPPHVQAAVFRCFARGEPLLKICNTVKDLGYSISRMALYRYRRTQWLAPHNAVRCARATVDIMKEAMLLDPDSDTARVAEELLYIAAIHRSYSLRPDPQLKYFREAREQRKLGGKALSSPASSPAPPSEDELDRRIREIYGLPEPGDDSNGR